MSFSINLPLSRKEHQIVPEDLETVFKLKELQNKLSIIDTAIQNDIAVPEVIVQLCDQMTKTLKEIKNDQTRIANRNSDISQ